MTLGTQGPEGGGQAPPLRLIASGYTLLAVVPHAAPENTCCAWKFFSFVVAHRHEDVSLDKVLTGKRIQADGMH